MCANTFLQEADRLDIPKFTSTSYVLSTSPCLQPANNHRTSRDQKHAATGQFDGARTGTQAQLILAAEYALSKHTTTTILCTDRVSTPCWMYRR